LHKWSSPFVDIIAIYTKSQTFSVKSTTSWKSTPVAFAFSPSKGRLTAATFGVGR